MHGELSHCPCKAAHLIGGLALGPKARQESACECGVEFARREAVHEFVSVALGQRLAIQQTVEDGAQVRFGVGCIHDAFIRMKLAIRRSPSGVSTLSG